MADFETRTADWLTYEEALRRCLASATATEEVEMAVAEAEGTALARDLGAPLTLPPGPTSAMDGYAVRGADVAGGRQPASLEVIGTSRPGSPWSGPVESGRAVRIMTGALLPEGTDTVVPVERTSETEGTVTIPDPVPFGDCVRPAGEEMEAETLLAGAGDSLTPGRILLLASAGLGRVPVHRRPRVALLVTGDELIAPSSPDALEGGVLRADVISPSFPALIRAAGGDPLPPLRASDTREELRAAFRKAFREADLVITTGGASMGEADLVKRVLEEDFSFQLDFWRTKLRPGSPVSLGFVSVGPKGVGPDPGSDEGEKTRRLPVVGLPGNPVSAFVTFHALARPLLRALGGHSRVHLPRIRARLSEGLQGHAPLTYFFRVRLTPTGEGRWEAELAGDQRSGVNRSAAEADGLAVLPEGVDQIDAGDEVEVILLEQAGWPGRG